VRYLCLLLMISHPQRMSAYLKVFDVGRSVTVSAMRWRPTLTNLGRRKPRGSGPFTGPRSLRGLVEMTPHDQMTWLDGCLHL